MFNSVNSCESDQTAQMCSLIRVFAVCSHHEAHFLLFFPLSLLAPVEEKAILSDFYPLVLTETILHICSVIN